MNKKVPLGVTIALMIIAVSVAVTISQIVSAVSYTHLDVYKRQVRCLMLQRWCGNGQAVSKNSRCGI